MTDYDGVAMRERREIVDAAYASGLSEEYAVSRPSDCRTGCGDPLSRRFVRSDAAGIAIVASARPSWTSMTCLHAWLKCNASSCHWTNCSIALSKIPRRQLFAT